MSFYIANVSLACGSQEGHMWVTSGLLCGSVGQVGQQVKPTFNSALKGGVEEGSQFRGLISQHENFL